MRALSVAIITYNEERNLADCIRSCIDLADEILVLDSFSTDATEAVARSFPKVRFERNRFEGHVQQKNEALARCRNDWVLSIDADERLTPALADEIAALEPEGLVGYRVPRLTYVGRTPIRHSGWYPQRRYRLVQRTRARWAGENPHDVLVIDGPGGDLRSDLLHFSFRDLADMVVTANGFSSIQAMNLHGKRRRWARLKAVLVPPVKFLECFFLKGGVRDGFAGFVVAVVHAFTAFLRFAKLQELASGQVERPSNVRPDYKWPSRTAAKDDGQRSE